MYKYHFPIVHVHHVQIHMCAVTSLADLRVLVLSLILLPLESLLKHTLLLCPKVPVLSSRV